MPSQSSVDVAHDDLEPSSVASNIPLDVLDVIFASLLPQDLAVCCRVSKAVSSIAVDALYRHVQPTPRNILHLCLKLCNEPNLARRVRSFKIHANVDMYLGVISDALPKLVRLDTLVLNIGPSSSWVLPSGDACPFLLRTFMCTFQYDAPLISFLNGQQDLLYLTIPSSNALRLTVPKLMMPKLVSICAPLALVEALVPGRPVYEVSTVSNQGQNGPSISCLSKSTNSLGVLRLMVNYRYLESIGCEILALAAPNLLTLTLDLDHIKPDDDEMLDDLIEYMEEYLSYAKSLGRLIIRFYPSLSRIPCQELDFSDMITSIFAASVKLRFVVIAFFGFKAKYVCERLPGHDWYIVND
ncbi:hypothetical protein BDN70DRAFT_465897 [Pholiota conissans]|uniref:F-box domain-containing protein n=1 Tax=Pholiota conissans TaxID=109636 RepID=A0A9P5ZEE1_9AGAR|nr:hypothetical protein BDN70DRAFT_465897 [Pholiota conissans]